MKKLIILCVLLAGCAVKEEAKDGKYYHLPANAKILYSEQSNDGYGYWLEFETTYNGEYKRILLHRNAYGYQGGTESMVLLETRKIEDK